MGEAQDGKTSEARKSKVGPRQVRLRKQKLHAGMKVGRLTVLQRVRDNTTTTSLMLRVQYRVECECGERLTTPAYYLTRENPKQDCGKCRERPISAVYNNEYRIWLMMHVRCEDPRHEAYKHYGGRRIKICPEWHKSRGIEGFKAFLECLGPRPSMKHTIDRTDNDLGYQPFQEDGVTPQMRWATASQQRLNQRPR